jgi:hypothetical protein
VIAASARGKAKTILQLAAISLYTCPGHRMAAGCGDGAAVA